MSDQTKMNDDKKAQEAICRKYGVSFTPAPDNLKVGVARNVRNGILPINGLRHPPEGDTTGWYIWAGEQLSDDPDFLLGAELTS